MASIYSHESFKSCPGCGQREMRLWKNGPRDATPLVLKMREMARAKECRQHAEAGKGEETHSSLQAPYLRFDFNPVRPMLDF